MGDFIDPPSDAAYLAVLNRLDVAHVMGLPRRGRCRSTKGFAAFPIYFVPGNHDDRDAFCRCLFPKARPSRRDGRGGSSIRVCSSSAWIGQRGDLVVYPETLDSWHTPCKPICHP